MAPSVADEPEVLELFRSGLPLVELYARKLGGRLGALAEHDDLLSAGREGLLEAARRFDPTRGVPFAPFATHRVRGAMLDAIRSTATFSRRTHERLRALEAAHSVTGGELEYAFQRPGGRREGAQASLDEHLEIIATATALGALNPAAQETIDDPEQQLLRAEFAAEVQRLIDELPVEAAALVRRHLIQGERLADIARDFSMSASWASRLLNRTSARLAKRLRKLA